MIGHTILILILKYASDKIMMAYRLLYYGKNKGEGKCSTM
jgi:hypothetical protein